MDTAGRGSGCAKTEIPDLDLNFQLGKLENQTISTKIPSITLKNFHFSWCFKTPLQKATLSQTTPKNVLTAFKFQFNFQLMHFYCKSIFHNSRRMMKHRRVFVYAIVISCTAGKHYSFDSCVEKKWREIFPILQMFFYWKFDEVKRVRISVTRDGKINKALNMNRNWLFLNVPLKLWGVMNSILFDYTNQTEENRKFCWSNSVVCYWIDQFSMLQIEWISKKPSPLRI